MSYDYPNYICTFETSFSSEYQLREAHLTSMVQGKRKDVIPLLKEYSPVGDISLRKSEQRCLVFLQAGGEKRDLGAN